MLEVNGLDTYYGNIQVLRGVSLEVPEGAIVALLGANGAGKSTLLKSIAGLIPGLRGEIRFKGQSINRCSAEKIVRLGIGLVPEGRGLFGPLTVGENLRMGAFTRKDKSHLDQDYERVFKHFPTLKERLSQLASSLSGGEQQMLTIGRSLMQQPKILLLDEPTLGLAPQLVEHIMEIIKQINQEGTTVLLVEQNSFAALSVAGYGYVLETGKIALSGSSSELRENPMVIKSYLGG